MFSEELQRKLFLLHVRMKAARSSFDATTNQHALDAYFQAIDHYFVAWTTCIVADPLDFYSYLLRKPTGIVIYQLAVPRPSANFIDFFRLEAADPSDDKVVQIVSEPKEVNVRCPADSTCPLGCLEGECAAADVYLPETPLLVLVIALKFNNHAAGAALFNFAQTHFSHAEECFSDAEAYLHHA